MADNSMIGKWVDYTDLISGTDMILEIVVEMNDSYLCRIVEYNNPDYFKLKYGGYISVMKGLVN